MSIINDIEELPENAFSIIFKLIQKYQRAEPSIKAKYEDGTYHRSYYCGGSNIDLKRIVCKDKIFPPWKLQSYVLYCYHTYLINPGMDVLEETICQHLYCPDIIYAVLKEVTNCDTCQRKK